MKPVKKRSWIGDYPCRVCGMRTAEEVLDGTLICGRCRAVIERVMDRPGRLREVLHDKWSAIFKCGRNADMCPGCGEGELRYRSVEGIEPHGERYFQCWYECPRCGEVFEEAELRRLEAELDRAEREKEMSDG